MAISWLGRRNGGFSEAPKFSTFLGVSENHQNAPSFREPRCSTWLDTRKTIAVQLPLNIATQA
jgi:hypothetical protein